MMEFNELQLVIGACIFTLVVVTSLLAMLVEKIAVAIKEYITDTKDDKYCFKTVTFMNAVIGNTRREHFEHLLYDNMIDRHGKTEDSDNGVGVFWYKSALISMAIALWQISIVVAFGYTMLRLARFAYRINTKLEIHLKSKDTNQ